MKRKQIRQNCWETNSSSTHSLTIVNESRRENVNIDDYTEFDGDGSGAFVFTGGEFGWEREEYSGFRSKMQYAYTLVVQDDLSFSSFDSKEIAEDYPDKSPQLIMLEKVLKDNIKGLNQFRYTTGYYYVDHQSVDHMMRDIFESEDSLTNFLFNCGSVFETSNDNDDDYY